MMNRMISSKPIKDDYIFRFTDDTGMFQHSKFGIPDPAHGYTTDDNVRALIMALMIYERYKEKKYMDLVYRYASFLLNAQNEKGTFKNFMDYSRNWLEEEGSEDCFGRCLWALGFALSNEFTPLGVRQGLSDILKKAIKNVVSLSFPRAKAYSIIGLSKIENSEAQKLVYDLANSLCLQYNNHKDGKWKWFEDTVTYCNSILPWSLFAAYKVTGEKRFLETAEESLNFLENVTFKEGYFKPVGCNGWLLKNGVPSEFDEQPVEACETMLTYIEAYEVTGINSYREKAEICYRWYEGFNSRGISLVDNNTGGCFDGLTEEGVNLNMGAESLVSYIISFLKISSIDQ
ncbi:MULTISPECIES: hypothetical protein [unclassified Clostridium]|uniref:hypothetical protein n=1 Tax=unclassified Clostridium TaxID=2614128 RepID=UPI0002977F65|nr:MULTISPECIES: hypothetical protein [unclassified Clostridium]EKQ55431.1 MAG: hypothetical protein A370_02647 [Clostridium sp. Maddingley MBC34-26]